jgi:hypothetical protein
MRALAKKNTIEKCHGYFGLTFVGPFIFGKRIRIKEAMNKVKQAAQQLEV